MAYSGEKIYKQLVTFIREATGLEEEVIKQIIGLYHLFIAAQLVRGKAFPLRGLLTLIPYLGRKPDIRAKISAPLNKAMYVKDSAQGKKTHTLAKCSEEFPTKIKPYSILDREEEKAIVEEIKTYAVLNGVNYISDTEKIRDLIRHSLIQYLSHNFVYGWHWTHPISNEEYSRGEIAKSLLYMRNHEPTLYALVYGLWLGIKNRNRLYAKLGVKKEELVELSNRAIDALVISITHPGFVPASMKEIIRWQAEWNEGLGK